MRGGRSGGWEAGEKASSCHMKAKMQGDSKQFIAAVLLSSDDLPWTRRGGIASKAEIGKDHACACLRAC
eukprot:scaffold386_cov19-Tisochrysis_lutea.AAC.1